jgi:hypothetical protein
MTPTVVVCLAVLVAIVVFAVIMMIGFVLSRRPKEE